MNEKNTLSKVNVLFSSSKLLIEFLKDHILREANAYYKRGGFIMWV